MRIVVNGQGDKVLFSTGDVHLVKFEFRCCDQVEIVPASTAYHIHHVRVGAVSSEVPIVMWNGSKKEADNNKGILFCSECDLRVLLPKITMTNTEIKDHFACFN